MIWAGNRDTYVDIIPRLIPGRSVVAAAGRSHIRAHCAMELEGEIVYPGSLGLVLAEVQKDRPETHIMVREVSPAGLAITAIAGLAAGMELVGVNGGPIVGIPYEQVILQLQQRPVRLNFSGHGPEASVVLENVPGQSYGMNIGTHAVSGDAVITGFTNHRPEAAGILPGSTLMRINSINVTGQGHAGVYRVMSLPEVAEAPHVEFVVRAPPGSSADAPAGSASPSLGYGAAPVICTFDEDGPLGIVFEQSSSAQVHRVLLVSNIIPDTQAEKFLRLKPGLLIKSVNGKDVDGMSIVATTTLLRSRPVTIVFVPPGVDAKQDLSTPYKVSDEVLSTQHLLDRVDTLLRADR